MLGQDGVDFLVGECGAKGRSILFRHLGRADEVDDSGEDGDAEYPGFHMNWFRRIEFRLKKTEVLQGPRLPPRSHMRQPARISDRIEFGTGKLPKHIVIPRRCKKIAIPRREKGGIRHDHGVAGERMVVSHPAHAKIGRNEDYAEKCRDQNAREDFAENPDFAGPPKAEEGDDAKTHSRQEHGDAEIQVGARAEMGEKQDIKIENPQGDPEACHGQWRQQAIRGSALEKGLLRHKRGFNGCFFRGFPV